MSSFDQLKTLLFGPEQKRLSKIDRRVEDLEKSSSLIAEKLPGAIREVSDDEEFLASLDRPVTKTLHQTIRRDVNSFAEVLFPVMGPAIRRAVADAMKNLVQRINVVLEQRFSVRGMKWRLESWRTGIPVSQIILQNTMLFSVQEVFLIHRESGIVIGQAVRNPVTALDEDAVSSMLTAIQSFIQDSFGGDRNEVLRSAELGDQTLWVINGPAALLACVIVGSPPRELRDQLMEQLESLHGRFATRFEQIALHKMQDEELNRTLELSLLEQSQETEKAASWISRGFWLVAALVLLLALIWWGLRVSERRQMQQTVVELLNRQPGVVVGQSGWQDGILQVQGLKDPLSPPAAALLQQQNLDPSRVATEFKPYYSLEPEMLARRLALHSGLANAAAFQIQGNALRVTAPVTEVQANRITELIRINPVLESVSFETVLRPDVPSLGDRILDRMNAPDSVSLAVNDGGGTLSGTAPYQWIVGSRGEYAEVEGVRLDWRRLWPDELENLLPEVTRLHETDILFSGDLTLTPEAPATLERLAEDVEYIVEESKRRSAPLAIRIIGATDGIGSLTYNQQLRMRRARLVRDELIAAGIDPDALLAEGSSVQVPSGEQPELRRVSFQVGY